MSMLVTRQVVLTFSSPRSKMVFISSSVTMESRELKTTFAPCLIIDSISSLSSLRCESTSRPRNRNKEKKLLTFTERAVV